MEFSQSYKNKIALLTFLTSVRQSLSTYVSQHASEFEALTRGGTPFGGNWMPARRYTTAAGAIRKPEKSTVRLQQQIDKLTQTAARLNRKIQLLESNGRITGNGTPTAGQPTAQIGINRFRSLRAKAC